MRVIRKSNYEEASMACAELIASQIRLKPDCKIGLATGYVKELYHPGYVAKRMEVGAVIAAPYSTSISSKVLPYIYNSCQ